MTLRSHLLLLAVGAIVPVLAFAIMVSVILFEQQRDTAQLGAVNSVRAMMTAVDTELRGSLTALQALGASRTLERDDLPGFYDEAVLALIALPSWANITLDAPDGTQLFSARNPFVEPPAMDSEALPKSPVSLSASGVGNLQREPDTTLVVPVSIPIKREGAVKYILSARVKPEIFSAIVLNQHLPPNWVSGIVDANGRFVARVPSRLIGEFASLPFRTAVAGAQEGWYRGLTVENKDTYTAHIRSAFSGWSIGLGVPVAEISATFDRTAQMVGVGALLSIAVALVLALYLGQRILLPIRALAAAARAVGTGEAQEPPQGERGAELATVDRVAELATVGRVAELAQVAAALREAGAAVRERQAQLSDVNAELQKRHEWLEVTLSSIGDAVIATDTQARVTLINTVACALTGWAHAEAIGQPIDSVFNIINEHSRRRADNPVFRAIQQATVVGLANHTVLISRHGKEVPIDDSAAPIFDSRHEILGVVLIFRDISERKAMERANSEAERRKDHFLAILSHELRGPLNPIRSAVGILRLPGAAEPQLVRARDIIDRQVGSLARLLDDLLDVSRIAQNKLLLRMERVDLGQVVMHAVETCRTLFDGNAQQLEVDVPTGVFYAHADPTRMEQVVCNLLSNAAKYTPKAGTIAVSLRAVAGNTGGGAGEAAAGAAVSVKDSGIGLAPKHLTSIFELFSQVDESTLDRRVGGLGIGLSVAKNLVELHGGRIEARSSGPHQGAEFIFTVPLAEDAAHAAASVGGSAAHDGRQGLNVLVADDNEDSADSLKMLLEAYGHTVHAAHDGLEAVALATEFRPDVAILDIGMPGLNGYEVARSIRGQAWGAGIWLVAATGWGQEEDVKHAMEAGFTTHLTKPVDIAQLQAVLDKVMASLRQARG